MIYALKIMHYQYILSEIQQVIYPQVKNEE